MKQQQESSLCRWASGTQRCCLALLLMLSSTQAAYAMELKNTTSMGIMGASVGLGISAAVATPVAAGVGIGALLGAANGHRADLSIEKHFQGSEIRVVNDIYGTSLLLPTDVFFKPGVKAQLDPRYYPSLNRLAAFIRSGAPWSVTVSGHTDTVLSNRQQHQLSEQLASVVADYLLSKGVPGYRLVAIRGDASRYPISTDQSFAGRAQNRRVEVTLQLHD